MGSKYVQPYVYRKHATEDARKEKYQGCESRQVLRRLLRKKLGHARGLAKYREIMKGISL